jgi:hypothetical protein
LAGHVVNHQIEVQQPAQQASKAGFEYDSGLSFGLDAPHFAGGPNVADLTIQSIRPKFLDGLLPASEPSTPNKPRSLSS